MERSFRGVLGLLAPAMVVLSMGPAIGSAAERSGKPRADGEQSDLFVAMQQGQVNVQFIPQDENRCRLLVTNKTDKPLSVKLPDSFVSTPVLARRGTFPLATRWERTTSPASTTFQAPRPHRRSPTRNRPNASAAARDLAGRGKTASSMSPEATRQVKLETICLDYGHPRPRPAIKYQIRPGAVVADKEGLAEVCELLGRQEIDHRAAQLAAWHLSNDMSWEKLAGLRTKQTIGTKPSYTKDGDRRREESGREGDRLAQAAAEGRQTDLGRLGDLNRTVGKKRPGRGSNSPQATASDSASTSAPRSANRPSSCCNSNRSISHRSACCRIAASRRSRPR